VVREVVVGGEGIILRYGETRQEAVRLTLIGLRARLLAGLARPVELDWS
jgi:hypothetical protein